MQGISRISADLGRTVSKSQAIRGGSGKIPYAPKQGMNSAQQGNKVPCSGESRDNSRADTPGAQLRKLTIEPAPILDDDNDPMTAEASDPTTPEPGDEPMSRLAAIVFGRDEAPDEALIAFVEGAMARWRARRGPRAGAGRTTTFAIVTTSRCATS